jgi:Rrf2 family protein
MMLDLALHYRDGFVRLKDVATRQDISPKYLGHLVRQLKKSGLITSSRGPQGGLRLAGDPRLIRLTSIIKAVEGDPTFVECVAAPDVCPRSQSCVTRDIWAMMGAHIRDFLDSVTLQDLVERQHRKNEGRALMWHI